MNEQETAVDESESESLGKKQRNLWPLMPVALLGLVITAQVVLVSNALKDGGAAVEEDYYKKAVNWDDHMAQERANQQLGWRLKLVVKPVGAGQADLHVMVLDKRGALISDADVQVVAFPNAKSDHRFRQTLQREAGSYVIRMPVIRRGLWEFRFDVARGEQRYTQVERQDILSAVGCVDCKPAVLGMVLPR
ncbi:MAG: FixH family protein [Polyangiaceae bacterium]|nr:FixH family protein [Myxococcales bacterium]MCB9589911.1 FixH family protein [Polyangiaceae bacterium]